MKRGVDIHLIDDEEFLPPPFECDCGYCIGYDEKELDKYLMKKGESKLFCIFSEEDQLYYGWYEDKPNIIGSGKSHEEVEADVLDSISIVEEHLNDDLVVKMDYGPTKKIKVKLVKKPYNPKIVL